MAPSIIICTLNRPRELHACLNSVAGQVLLPAVVIIVDASDPEVFDANGSAAQLLVDRPGVEIRHLPSSRGLTAQRNVGIEVARATGADWVQFLDDDVELLPDYLAKVDEWFKDPLVVGVEGVDQNQRAEPRRVFRILYPRLRAGACLSKTGHNWFPQAATACSVDWLSGCAPAYRLSLFDALRFDERRTGGGHGEDVDFSFRAALRGSVVYDPTAGYLHRPSSLNRRGGAELGHDVVVHRHTLSHDFKDSFRPAWVRYGFLIEAMWTLAAAVVRRSPERRRYANVLLLASYRRREHVLDRARG